MIVDALRNVRADGVACSSDGTLKWAGPDKSFDLWLVLRSA